ncbi:hypothetical protein Leryth_005859 [Lithospermum erythrorhizon]|nr:hypothetical protein Leryth_005859 [Lithospermum erythrorhizon]
MGLQNQLTDVSSESIPILVVAVIANCICYIRSFLFSILHGIGVVSDHDHQMDDSSVYDVVGSGLAGVVLLAEQLNLNRVFSYNYHEKEDPNSKCVVCLNYFGDGDHVRKLGCRHVFHKDCLDGWLDHLNFSCPLCRSKLISDERVESTRRRIGEDSFAWFAMR